MSTLSANTVRRWLNDLTEIAAALKMAEDIKGIEHPQWRRIWEAKASAIYMHDQLQTLAVVAVAVEQTELVA